MNDSKLIFIFILFIILLILGYFFYLKINNKLNFSFLEIKFNEDFKKLIKPSFRLEYNKPSYSTSSNLYKSNQIKTNVSLNQNKSDNKINMNNQNKQKKAEEKEIIPPLGFEKKELSPYYQKISFHFNRGVSNYFNSIVIYNNSNEEINITNWYFKTNRGMLFTIPKGIEDFNLSSYINYSDIILKSKNKAVIYRGFNPTGIKYFNIRLNKCSGYLNNVYNFNPPLPRECPRLEVKDLIFLSGECQNFLKNLKMCYQPTAFDINKFANEYNCRKYFDQLNYGYCYQKYRQDNDFFKNEWRIYLKPEVEVFDFNLDKLHDRIMLFDQNNLLVAIVVY